MKPLTQRTNQLIDMFNAQIEVLDKTIDEMIQDENDTTALKMISNDLKKSIEETLVAQDLKEQEAKKNLKVSEPTQEVLEKVGIFKETK